MYESTEEKFLDYFDKKYSQICPSDEKINRLVVKLSRDSRFDTKQCNCGNYTNEFKKCKACGKNMCIQCENTHGNLDSALCWKPGRLKFRRIPGTDSYEVTDLDTGQISTAG